MNQFSSRGGWSSIPPVTRNLIIINVLIWVVIEICSASSGSLASFGHKLPNLLGLHFFESSAFNPMQIITYMFVHDPSSIFHLLFNMFSLWMFGRLMEQVWGGKRFLLFYMICGIGAALVQEGVWALTWYHDYVEAIAPQNHVTYQHMSELVNAAMANHDPAFLEAIDAFKSSMLTVGASGAIFGILLGFAFVFPNLPTYLFFIPIPIKAKWMVMGYAIIEFFAGVTGTGGTVAHFAHLGGMLFGLVMLLYWKKKGTLGGNLFR